MSTSDTADKRLVKTNFTTTPSSLQLFDLDEFALCGNLSSPNAVAGMISGRSLVDKVARQFGSTISANGTYKSLLTVGRILRNFLSFFAITGLQQISKNFSHFRITRVLRTERHCFPHGAISTSNPFSAMYRINDANAVIPFFYNQQLFTSK
ncbi:hypothetical protein RUND412_005213 [Rhizina undulata]